MLKGRSVQSILRPIIMISRLFGCYSGEGEGRLSYLWATWTMLLCFVLGGVFVYNSVYHYYTVGTIFGHKYLVFMEVMSCLQIVSCLLAGLQAGPALARTIATLSHVERVLKQREVPVLYCATSILADSCIRIAALGAISYVRLAYSRHVLTRSLALISLFCLSVTEIFNLALLTCLKQCLAHLNNHLNFRNVHITLSVENVLLEASKDYRAVTERRLLFRLGTTYIITILDLFFVLTRAPNDKNLNKMLYLVLGTPYNFYEILVTIYTIYYFCQQTCYLRITLFGLVLSDETNTLSNDAKIRAHLNMKNFLTFSACGFFPLDATVIHSILASLANYLTILSQFGNETRN